MYDIVVKKIEWDIISKYQKDAEAEGILFSDNSTYYAFYLNGRMFGFGAILYKGKDATSKSDWIFPPFRKKGLYGKAFELKKQLAFDNGIKYLHGHCTTMSIGTHKRLGAEIIKVYKNGITKIRYENI